MKLAKLREKVEDILITKASIKRAEQRGREQGKRNYEQHCARTLHPLSLQVAEAFESSVKRHKEMRVKKNGK